MRTQSAPDFPDGVLPRGPQPEVVGEKPQGAAVSPEVSNQAAQSGYEWKSTDYMHARYYSPNLGRFLSVDPIRSGRVGSSQSWNRYSYSLNNPIVFLDPNGKETKVYVVKGGKTPLSDHTFMSTVTPRGELVVSAGDNSFPLDGQAVLGDGTLGARTALQYLLNFEGSSISEFTLSGVTPEAEADYFDMMTDGVLSPANPGANMFISAGSTGCTTTACEQINTLSPGLVENTLLPGNLQSQLEESAGAVKTGEYSHNDQESYDSLLGQIKDGTQNPRVQNVNEHVVRVNGVLRFRSQ